jgi:acetyl-CoA carboxylase biotin carboxyl carrier protein
MADELIRSVWEQARDLMARVEGTTLRRISVEAGGTKIEIERDPTLEPVTAVPGAVVATPDGVVPVELETGHAVKAPLVGTFYRSSQPGADPFVQEGDVVDAGQTVAIVEAMKLMNQVPSDVGGKVARILVADGEWVEFEQTLMIIEPLEE